MKDGDNATILLTVNNNISIDYVFFSSRRRHTRFDCDWSSDVCSSDLRPQTSPPCGRAPCSELPHPCTHGGRIRLARMRLSCSYKLTRQESLRHPRMRTAIDRKTTRLNSSHSQISYAVFCLKKKTK